MAYTKTVDLGAGFDHTKLWEKKQAKKKQKNFLVDNISTAGGIGGSLAGASLGAAAGSVVPVIGTAAGGIIGALLGGALGGGGGQAAENVITHDNLWNGVGQEALMNGVMGAGPIRAGSLALRTAGGLVTGSGKRALAEAGTKAMTDAPIRTVLGLSKTGAKLERGGNRLLGSQANLGKKDIRELGAGRTPESVISSLNKRYGARNIDQMAEVAGNVTGKNGAYSELTRNAIGNSKGVDLGDIRTVANDLMIDKGTRLSAPTRKQILDSVKHNLVKANGGSKGSLNPLSNPLEAFDVAKSWESQAAEMLNKATVTTADKQQAAIYKELAKTVNERLFNAPGVKEGLDMAKGDAARSFEQMAAKAPTKQQREIYKKLAQETQGIKDVKQLRKLQSDWVAASEVNKGVEMGRAGASQALGGQAQGLGKMVQRPMNLAAVPLDAATPRVASGVARAGRALQGRGGGNPYGVLPVTGRVGIAGALTNQGTPVDPSQQQQVDPAQLDALYAQQGMQDPSQMQQQEPSIAGYTQTQIEVAMARALAAGDSEAFTQLKQLYSMLPSADNGMSSNTAALAAKQATGATILDQLQQSYAAAGGGQGALGGNIANILGNLNLNSAAGTYNDQLAGDARLLSRAMGETGAGSDSDANAYISQLPRLTDSPERAAQKIALLRQKLAAARQNTLVYGAGTGNSGSSVDPNAGY